MKEYIPSLWAIRELISVFGSWPPNEPSTIPEADVVCEHQFVNVGFNTIVMACRHCDLEK